jgi:AcrR family transcriptional regulator
MRPQDGKDKILTAALTLFAQNGFHATSVSQIAKAAKVSKGLTYNYFDSKEALLLAIIERASETMMAVAGEMATGGGYQIMLRDFLDRYGKSLKANNQFLTFQLSLMFQPDLKTIVAGPMHARAEQLLAITETMFSKAGAAEPLVVARRFVSELDGITLHYLSVFKNYPLDEMLVHLYQNYKELPQ